jgi:ABC-type phosphate transport system permease subunit/ABC-type phosphate transport system auxiliary subunit
VNPSSALAPPEPAPRPPAGPVIIKRRTTLLARGEPMVWLTGAALTLSLLMIVTLVAVVVLGGFGVFWQRPIDLVTLKDGAHFMGLPVREESFDPGPDRRDELAGMAQRGELPSESLDSQGLPVRRLYRVGNREMGAPPFRWVNLSDLRAVERPADALMLERTEWSVWLGRPQKMLRVRTVTVPGTPGSVPGSGTDKGEDGERPVERTVIGPGDGGVGTVVRETVVLAEGAEATLAAIDRLLPGATALRERVKSINRDEVGRINREIEHERLRLRGVELRARDGRADKAALDAARARFDERSAELEAEFGKLRARATDLEQRGRELRLVITDDRTGSIAPIAPSQADEPMPLENVVRAVRANTLGTGDRLSLYLGRWWEYLTTEPRNDNTEGGVMPVIFGTVTMTLLLSVLVVPLGVMAALYLREYARQGAVVSAVRIAVNNLAGVPSIVYGVFGLGFFCYTVGGFIDSGPPASQRLSPGAWWALAGAWVVAVALAATAQKYGRPRPGRALTAVHAVMAWVTLGAWIGVAGLLVALLATTPYFNGFFEERLPTQTFGTKGILWASLTLSLLTLPVVIVATEEAISAVPKSMREASYGCGASKWQTIRRVVLPRAAPGIMTGMILAMARGAGEVAPLMLVGAVKDASALPIEAHWPFLHAERSFMHLGFHIFDLGFQSPDAEAARPLVWTTTALLITIVVMMNMTAIWIRARLRRRFVTGHF